MTNNEAIAKLTNVLNDDIYSWAPELLAAFAMAVDALRGADGDYISRQAALDAMETWDKFGCDPNGKLVRYDDDKHYIPYVHYEDMVHAIKHLPSVQQWIPCSERMPETDNEVLITVLDAEDDYVEVYKGFYQDHEWWTQWCHGCLKIKDEPCGVNTVTAWMPLPEPYKDDPCNGCDYLGESCVGEGCGKLTERKEGEADD